MMFSFLVLLGLSLAPLGFCQSSASQPSVPGVPWRAVDDFGRQVVAEREAPELRANKTVGMFYFLWLLPDSNIPVDVKNRPVGESGPYDLTRILEKDPDPVQNDAVMPNNGEMCFWGEPLFGYYDSRDPWVVSRHVRLLTDAGIDALIFDATNLRTYPEVYLPLCEALLDARREGFPAPRVAFMLNTQIEARVRELWRDFYSKPEYAPTFFLWEGKPLLLADPEQVPEEFRDKFTLRSAYWPTNGTQNVQNAWQWIAGYPQTYAWTTDEKVPEEVSVSVSQNLTRDAAADPAWESVGNARGRSFVWGDEEERAAPDLGLNYDQQWLRALELDPPFALITGWNEWIAGRWLVSRLNPETKQGEALYAFIDQYNYEFSRDAEPTRASKFVDSYYLRTVDGVRRYKGAPRAPRASARKTIDFEAGFDQWRDVEPSFRDYFGETTPRDFPGVGGTRYRNDSGRNDIVLCKTTRDADFVFVYIETRDPIAPTPPDGLRVLFDSDADLTTGWRGGDLLLGTRYEPDGSVSLETFDASQKDSLAWSTKESLAGARWNLEGNKLQVSVPARFFQKGASEATIFKALDNVPLNSPADLYDQGDVAPESAFFYAATYEPR
ncbi:MAG: hypothetical protein IJM30_03975 [Thermoguttaceae bacterium]|nr:hypothetical protein [Thermoguttaceae bacterium]